ncbi:MAG: tRNA-dihydrouridine synthase family protein [Fibrella sp.]|nr:tRNA-dihydrouridine synthase family protein [Armatimonadota bacterium]
MNTPIRIVPGTPAIVLAPMDGLTDAPMRAVQGEIGAFTFAVSEFVRVSATVVPKSVFYRQVPELHHGAMTPHGLPVQVQLLGGDAERMAQSALVACAAGATAIDINFGCPAPTVNTHDGGATLLKHPTRIREIVAAVRGAVPPAIPVSAKLRLGWDSTDAIFENAAMAAAGGADWLTIHGRTRAQGYKPPVLWENIAKVREQLSIPVVANGDIWTLAGFRRCRAETGCTHFMLGRGALADPFLTHAVAAELDIHPTNPSLSPTDDDTARLDWRPYLRRIMALTPLNADVPPAKASFYLACRLKQWLKIANMCGNCSAFDAVKRAQSVEELFTLLTCFYDTTCAPSRNFPSGNSVRSENFRQAIR